MNFKYYDVLSTLISGVVLLFVLSIVIDWDINDINVTMLLSLAYVMGYLLNALSALLEPLYYWFIGGKPSDKLLKGLTAEYERITKLTYHQVRYLGEWHSHPNMPNTPSETDKKQFKELWEEQQSQDLPFVQMIYGNNGLFVSAAM